LYNWMILSCRSYSEYSKWCINLLTWGNLSFKTSSLGLKFMLKSPYLAWMVYEVKRRNVSGGQYMFPARIASLIWRKNKRSVISWMISWLMSSGKYLGVNLNSRGLFCLGMSWLSTFLASPSHVLKPFEFLYWRPKYQISRRPILLATWSNNCLPVVAGWM
jgi:hypothetical protein